MEGLIKNSNKIDLKILIVNILNPVDRYKLMYLKFSKVKKKCRKWGILIKLTFKFKKIKNLVVLLIKVSNIYHKNKIICVVH